MRQLAIEGISVTLTCRVLGLARRLYYRWLAGPVTDTNLLLAYQANVLFDAHRDDPEFSYRNLAAEAAAAGKRSWPSAPRDCCAGSRARGAPSVTSVRGVGERRRGAKSARVGPPVHDDLVRREFTTTTGLDQLSLADIIEHATGEGKLYLCAVKDACSGRIVGYSIDARMTSELTARSLEAAVARRGTASGCVFHADCGSRFRSRKLQHASASSRTGLHD